VCDTSIFYYDGDKIIAEREGNSWVVRYLLGLEAYWAIGHWGIWSFTMQTGLGASGG